MQMQGSERGVGAAEIFPMIVETGKMGKEQKITKAFCPRCRHMHEFVRPIVNHRVHLLLSVLTGGLWLVSWASLYIRSLMLWECEHCGCGEPQFERTIKGR